MEEITREEKLVQAKKEDSAKKEPLKTKDELLNKDMWAMINAKRDSDATFFDERIKEHEASSQKGEKKQGFLSQLIKVPAKQEKQEVVKTLANQDRQIIILIQSAEEITGAKLTSEEANGFYYRIAGHNAPDNMAPYRVKAMATKHTVESMFDLLYFRAKEQGKLTNVVDKIEQERTL